MKKFKKCNHSQDNCRRKSMIFEQEKNMNNTLCHFDKVFDNVELCHITLV